MEALDPHRAGGLEKRLGPEHVGADEALRGVNAAVHVGLGGKMEDHFDALHAGFEIRVADVLAQQLVPRGQPFQVLRVPGVGELVHVDDLIRRVRAEPIVDEIGADKTSSAGNQKFHSLPHSSNASVARRNRFTPRGLARYLAHSLERSLTYALPACLRWRP